MNVIRARDRSPVGRLRGFFRRLELAFFRSRLSWFFAVLMKTQAKLLYERACDELGPLAPGTVVADIGCGHGTLLATCLRRNPQTTGFGLDQSEELINFARKQCKEANLPVEFMVADVHDAPLPARAFDAMVSTSSIYCWHDPVRALDNLYESLKPGGRFLLWDILPINTLAEAWHALFELRVYGLSIPAYTESELRGFVERSRFKKATVDIDGLVIRFELIRPAEDSDPS
jgi:ubiquinone/menaquinone biosynthesis C-methylase UbiE